jgi:hypothetical protein
MVVTFRNSGLRKLAPGGAPSLDHRSTPRKRV